MLSRYIQFSSNISIDFLIKLVISTSLLLLSGPVVVDVKGVIPITLQSLSVLFGAIAFGWQIGLISVIIYIMAGLIGIPVFAGYSSGIEALTGPFGGFFFGFIAAAVLCGFLTEKEWFQRALPAILVWLIGHAVILLLGIVWLRRFDPEGWSEKLHSLITGAIIKSLAGALLIQLIIKFYTREKRGKAFED